MSEEQGYLASLDYILQRGKRKPNRTGTDTFGVLGLQNRYDLSEGFPLFTTKKVWFKGVAVELLWFLSGHQGIKFMVDNGVHIWDDDAYRYHLKTNPDDKISKEEFIKLIEAGDLWGYVGPGYGSQWRYWDTTDERGASYIDQVDTLIKGLKSDPTGRRHILTAWNPADISKMALPPCHVMSMWTVEENKLSCHMVQRSCDMFLGVPFNVASYSLLTHMIAQVCGYEVGEFIHTMHDAHIYMDHIDQVNEQLSREPRRLPRLQLNPEIKNINDFKLGDIEIIGYDPHPAIKAPLSTADVKNHKA